MLLLEEKKIDFVRGERHPGQIESKVHRLGMKQIIRITDGYPAHDLEIISGKNTSEKKMLLSEGGGHQGR